MKMMVKENIQEKNTVRRKDSFKNINLWSVFSFILKFSVYITNLEDIVAQVNVIL